LRRMVVVETIAGQARSHARTLWLWEIIAQSIVCVGTGLPAIGPAETPQNRTGTTNLLFFCDFFKKKLPTSKKGC